MKKILMVVLATLMIVSAFTACAKPQPEETVQPTEITSTDGVAAEEPAEETANMEGIPDSYSPTTGIEGDGHYKPVIVQIENEPPARPQAGLQDADIVYETMIEAEATRFTCLYNDVYPEEVGPVRSSRYYHQRIQQEWDALYVHQGGPEDPNFATTYIYGESGEHIKQRVNGVGKDTEYADLVYRRENTGKALEHTAYTNVAKDVEVYNYDPVVLQQFKFYPLEDYADNADAKDIEKVELGFWREPGFVEYRYDAASDKLIRYMGGKEFLDEGTGKAVEVQNVIVQYASVTEAPNEGGRKIVEMSGEGPAEFYIHGKHMTGTWSRPTYGDRTVFMLANGEELTFAPGNTWIEVHPNNKSVVTTYTDGTESVTNA